jgi:CRP/FNR family cyclic AMP-dependent transcriptional regulator
MVDFQWENLFEKSKREKTLGQKLRENVLFQDLSKSELKLVQNIVNIRSYRPGENIFRQGEVGVGMYIISSGVVNIYVEEIDPDNSEMKTNLVTQLKEGSFLGDMALVEPDSRRTATAVAQEDCVLIGVYKPDLIEISDRNPSAGIKILWRLGEVLATRLKETTHRISEMKRVKTT